MERNPRLKFGRHHQRDRHLVERERDFFFSKFKPLNKAVRINAFVQYTVLTYTTKGWFKILIALATYVNSFFFKLETWKKGY